MQIIALNNQTLLDLAIQTSGAAEAAFALALENDLAITDELAPGMEIKTVPMSNKQIADYYANRGLKPATALSENTDENAIFDSTFDQTFN